MMQYGNQKIGQIVYVDANGVQHNIKEAYMGGQLVYSAKKNGFTVVASTVEDKFIWHKNGPSNKVTSVVPDMETTFVSVDGITDMQAMFSSNYPSGVSTGLRQIELDFDTSHVSNFKGIFWMCTNLNSVVFKNINTINATTFELMFYQCNKLVSLDLSKFVTPNLVDTSQMFQQCSRLVSIDLSNFDTSKVTMEGRMFDTCMSLTYIKCKQAFKDWCWANATTIKLPDAMKSGGSGTWEIVD